VKFGAWEAAVVSAGTFRLDGGAMFGTVPKVVWEPLCPADADNRILLDTNCLLLRGEVGGRRRTVLVDTGNGDKEPDGFMARFAFQGRGILAANLAAAGAAPADVDLVILTHLHFDHAGGATLLDPAGNLAPAFPNARYLVQRRDLDNARRPGLRERASYLPRNWEPLEAAGVLDTVQGEAEILPGIRVRPVPGHTPGLQAVLVQGEDRRLVFATDLIPTSHHLRPAWVMGYDLDVATCIEQRLKLLDEVAGTGDVLVFEHDPAVKAGTVARDAQGRLGLAPVAL
jgi:glyoxylase-like metal-dependent hydrolase (beta-lactamase superfamily II)